MKGKGLNWNHTYFEITHMWCYWHFFIKVMSILVNAIIVLLWCNKFFNKHFSKTTEWNCLFLMNYFCTFIIQKSHWVFKFSVAHFLFEQKMFLYYMMAMTPKFSYFKRTEDEEKSWKTQSLVTNPWTSWISNSNAISSKSPLVSWVQSLLKVVYP